MVVRLDKMSELEALCGSVVARINLYPAAGETIDSLKVRHVPLLTVTLSSMEPSTSLSTRNASFAEPALRFGTT
jgi:hypothetical protein